MQSRKWLQGVTRKILRDKQLQGEYKKTVWTSWSKATDQPNGNRIFYLLHEWVVKESASTTKVITVFDPITLPTPVVRNVNECILTGPAVGPRVMRQNDPRTDASLPAISRHPERIFADLVKSRRQRRISLSFWKNGWWLKKWTKLAWIFLHNKTTKSPSRGLAAKAWLP